MKMMMMTYQQTDIHKYIHTNRQIYIRTYAQTDIHIKTKQAKEEI